MAVPQTAITNKDEAFFRHPVQPARPRVRSEGIGVKLGGFSVGW